MAKKPLPTESAGSAANKAIRNAVGNVINGAMTPVRQSQQTGRTMSGYGGGTAGGLPVHDYSTYTPPTNPGGSGSGNGGGGSKSSAGGGSADLSAFLSAAAAAKQSLANDIYGNNMNRIADMYNNVAGNLGSNYDSTVSRLKAARDQSLKDVKLDAENSLRQAYINNELTKRNLNQRLAAMGYNGGATETSMGRLANEYSRSRGGINQTLNTNIANLNRTYEDNLANALQAYNDAMSQLEMQRMSLENAAENARASQSGGEMDVSAMLSGNSGYLQALQNALANQGAYTYNASQATNDYTPGTVQQADSAADVGNYQKYLEQAQLAAQNGTSVDDIARSLFPEVQAGNLNINSLAQLIRTLRAAG